jgi:hypothetical protein
VAVGATLGIGAEAVDGAAVGEPLSYIGDGVMTGTVDGAATSDGSSAGGSVGTWSGRCVCVVGKYWPAGGVVGGGCRRGKILAMLGTGEGVRGLGCGPRR